MSTNKEMFTIGINDKGEILKIYFYKNDAGKYIRNNRLYKYSPVAIPHDFKAVADMKLKIWNSFPSKTILEMAKKYNITDGDFCKTFYSFMSDNDFLNTMPKVWDDIEVDGVKYQYLDAEILISTYEVVKESSLWEVDLRIKNMLTLIYQNYSDEEILPLIYIDILKNINDELESNLREKLTEKLAKKGEN